MSCGVTSLEWTELRGECTEWSGLAGAHRLKCKLGGDACRRGWKGISPTSRAAHFSPPPSSHGDMMDDLASIPPSPNISPCCLWSGKGKLSGYTHLISPQSCPQGKLLILLQETDFHIVDFVPMKHHQHVGFCSGFCGAVSDQESAVLKQKEEWSSLRHASTPALRMSAVVTLVYTPFPYGLLFFF